VRRPRRYLQTLALAQRLSAPGARSRLWHLFYFVESIVIWRQLRRRGITHVHVHFANVAADVGMLAAHFGQRERCSWSFTMHGPTEFDDVVGYALAEKVRGAGLVVCIGDYCRSQLMKLVEPSYWDKLRIVHCGLDPASFPRVERGGHADGELEILCVGRLVPEKGQAVLLEAMAELGARGILARATIVGHGPDRARLEARARELGVAERVRFVGAVGQDRMPAHYAAADVFCLPSFAEGVPVVLMEAAASGMAIVTTRVAGIPELVHDGVSGAVVEPGRADAIADAIARLAVDPELRRRWGAAARDHVTAAYDIADSARQLHELFQRHAATPGTGASAPVSLEVLPAAREPLA
jgi:glycosyltransferase involved in cell wall biosynthesis